jgi:ribonuclease Z
MPKVIILGTSNAIPTVDSENTHMVLVGAERTVLIDSPGGSSILRLEQSGLSYNDLTDIIVTHFHPDHVSGIPLLLMDMWLMGREKPLIIHGLRYTVDRIKGMMDFFNWSFWPNFFPVKFHTLPLKEQTPVFDCSDFSIHSSPVKHFIPNIGLRINFKKSQKTLVYSCDTEPCEEVVRLSKGADILVHEATGDSPGHSSAKQAGQIASKAGVSRLYLIHYPTGSYAKGNLVVQARTEFSGTITLAKDFMVLNFNKKAPLSQPGKGVQHGVKKPRKISRPEP